MSSFVCLINKSNLENWDISKKYQRWGIQKSLKSTNPARRINKGSRLFICIADVGYIGVAESKVDEPEQIFDSEQSPWNNDCSFIIPWTLIKELDKPVFFPFNEDERQEETNIRKSWMNGSMGNMFEINEIAARKLSEICNTEYNDDIDVKFDPTTTYASSNRQASSYEAGARPISLLLDNIDQGNIQLPDLQRAFTWNPTQVSQFIDSIYKGYPVGYVMLWKNTNYDNNNFRKIGESDSKYVDELVLDGQQRLTALYSVLKGKSVSYKRFDPKTFVISFNPLTEHFANQNAAIVQNPEYINDISHLFTKDVFTVSDDFIKELEDRRILSDLEKKQIRNAINRVHNISNSTIQILQLAHNVVEEDAQNIFLRINSGGTRLTNIDFIQSLISLKWPNGRQEVIDFAAERITNNELVRPLDNQIIRVVSILAFRRAVMESVYTLLKSDDELEKYKSAQKETLDLNNWNEYLNCLDQAGFIAKEIIKNKTDNMVLYCYGFYLIGKEYGVHWKDLRKIIARWFFVCNLTNRYRGSAETTVNNDLSRFRNLEKPSDFVDIINDIINLELTQDFWEIEIPKQLETISRNNPVYRTFLASQILIDSNVLFSETKISHLINKSGTRKAVEQHHLFPKNYLAQNNYSMKEINQVANFTFLEWKENSEVSNQPPADYFDNHFDSIPRSEQDKMLLDHALWSDWISYDYNDFLVKRRKEISHVIKRGWEILLDKNYSSKKSFVSLVKKPTTTPWEYKVEELIGENLESQNLEFKSTYQWNIHSNQKDLNLKIVIIKAIVGFLNSQGGTLLIGVDDNGNILGLENDLKSFYGNLDKFQINFSDYIDNMIGKEYISRIHKNIEIYDDRQLYRVDVQRSEKPVFIKDDPKLYVRSGPRTISLIGAEMLEYIKKIY